jgi:hypothetical protein
MIALLPHVYVCVCMLMFMFVFVFAFYIATTAPPPPPRTHTHLQFSHHRQALRPDNTFVPLRLKAVPPTGGWQHQGQLRLLTDTVLPSTAMWTVHLNGHKLVRSHNASSLFGEGAQAKLAIYPVDQWAAWLVPPAAVVDGNNTVEITLYPNGTAARGLVHTTHISNSSIGDSEGGNGGNRAQRDDVAAAAALPPVVPRGPLLNRDFGTSGGAPYLHTYKEYMNKTAGALACQSACDADAKCAAWTYVIQDVGPGPERCCYFPAVGCPFQHTGCVSGAKATRTALCPSHSGGSATLIKLELSLPVGGW